MNNKVYHKIENSSIEDVLERARQYRSLLQPEMAISICLDIFAVDNNNQDALVIYILALTDQLSQSESKVHRNKITDSIKKLNSEFLTSLLLWNLPREASKKLTKALHVSIFCI